jgi:Zn finger protein HypA/HybF involved in hydrogenase expression
MHETIIAKQIIDEAEKHGKPRSITVEIGELAHIPADELKRTLQQMVKWKINTKGKKAVIKCGCGYKGNPTILEKGHDHNIYKCKKCSALMPKIVEGNKIILKKIEV